MNSRERLIKTLNHEQPDKLVVDFGATATTGISAVLLHKLTGKDVPILEPYQMLGKIDEELIPTDVVGIFNKNNMFGYENNCSQKWSMPDGTPVLMGENFKYKVIDGETYIYPCGDETANPSAKMTKEGVFFNAIDRSEPFDEENLTPIEDFKDSFGVMTDDDIVYLKNEVEGVYNHSDKGMIWGFGGAGFGDVAFLPGPNLKNPQGIRNIDDWLMAHLLYPQYIQEIFNFQCEVAIKNLEMAKQAFGNKIQAVYVSGADFGTQIGLISSIDTYRTLYKPFQKKVNDWIHTNTEWKTFYHSCGAISSLLDDFCEIGIDIINPVQCSAKGMEPEKLKEKYGGKLVFWGGGIDTQQVLPFGSVEEVKKQVRERIEIFNRGGGFVFNTIHNTLANTPPENFKAMLSVINEYR